LINATVALVEIGDDVAIALLNHALTCEEELVSEEAKWSLIKPEYLR
jgi:hypothetical protein